MGFTQTLIIRYDKISDWQHENVTSYATTLPYKF